MNGRFAPSVIEGWMDEVDSASKWMALFANDPLAGDPLAAEIIGGTYARQLGVWARTSPGALTLDAGLLWRSLVPGTVVYAVGAFDAAFNGNLLFRDMLVLPKTYPTGGTFSLAADEWVVGIDIPVI